MTISAIVPFYNLSGYVRECLDSIFAATKMLETKVLAEAKAGGAGGRRTNSPFSLEVICVDDGSTDRTGALLDEYASAVQPSTSNLQPVFRVIHQSNGGEGAARNAGLAVAAGEWVTFLDGDDVWLPNMLTEFADVAKRQSGADIIGFRFLPFDGGEKPPAAQAAVGTEIAFDVREEIPSKAILDLGVFPTFFRRAKFRGVKFSALPLGADRLYVAQCLANADRIVMSSAGVHGYRVREGSMARAVWNERKIKSMIDFAAGSLKAFSASDKRVGCDGAKYLGDVLLSVAAKQIRRMEGDKTTMRRHWLAVLASMDERLLTLYQRLKMWRYRLG